MASTTTRLTTFSFHHNHHSTQKHRSKTSLPCAFHGHKLPIFTHSSQKSDSSPFKVSSIDLSNKEDKLPTAALSDDSIVGAGDSPVDTEVPPPPYAAEEEEQTPQNIDPRRLEERFAVLNTGIYECRSCGYRYNEAVGDPTYPLPPGYQFAKLPDDWRCPTCGAAQSFFVSKSMEIAGFVQNQQYGLGGNTLTSGQKALLIYGSLLFFFALFLSGYFLQ